MLLKEILLERKFSAREILNIIGRNLEHIAQFGDHREAMIEQLEEMADYYDVETWQQALPLLVRERAPELIQKYAQMTGSFTLYRTLRLVDVNKINTDNFGIYWSTTMHDYPTHFGPTDAPGQWVPFSGTFTEDQVNWPVTITMNLMPDRGEEEDEVTLKDGVQIKLDGYYADGKMIPISKTVRA